MARSPSSRISGGNSRTPNSMIDLAVFYVMKKLKFRRAIRHGHVVGGSVLHYVAVLVGVVLARATG